MEIKPFKAYRFNPEVVGNPGDCIAPPYDVIDPSMQDELYRRNEYNIVRAIKGKASENVYTQAAEYLEAAVKAGALKQEDNDAIYAYVQDFEIAGQRFERSGIIACGKLKAFGEGVQPHEKTLEGPKADRLNLTRATACQLGQIFMLYDDATNVDSKIIPGAIKNKPVIDTTDEHDVRHRLFVIDDTKSIEMFVTMMGDKQTVIADGHHRYETALNYLAETQNDQAAYQMLTFVNMRNEGLVIQPTHRLLVDMDDFDVATVIEELKAEFEISEFAFACDAERQQARKQMFEMMRLNDRNNIFGLYAGTKAFYAIRLKDSKFMVELCPKMSEAGQRLDVNVLHQLILEKHLGICDDKLAKESHLVYIKDLGDAIDRSIAKVDSGESQGVFFMNSTRTEQVQAIAAAGEKMPQKSTFFYPKIFSGLTIRKLDTEPIASS
ncbi:MAG: hypothetical protein B6I25_05630 [Planctomycetales bacterium 4572_13]|nr:MAG: hypothetical protein B6I25_05630 [Planctomycetales bacterium 4572_13]